jgi:acetyl-CoA C-acetyltransferase
MYKYGITPEQTAGVAVKNLENAIRNPNAHNKGRFSVEEVLASQLVADPIRQMEIAPDTDGAVALILASEDKARRITDTPVWVKGLGVCYDAHYLGDRDLSDCMALEKAAQQAYRMAGIVNPRNDVDIIELGEEFSYQELLWLEGLGVCERGEAGKLLERGVTALGGDLPVNPSGGLLSGVPANVMGLNRAAEAALQLMGKAGDRQVPGVMTAIVQGHSGFCGQHQCVLVLGK